MNTIEHAVQLLKEGKLIALPTETVYGLGADAKNPSAVQKIFLTKGRPATNPLIIHLPDVDAIQDWAIDIPPTATTLAQAFWPGPLTIILKKHPSVPLITTAGQNTVAIRIPNHPLALAVLKQFQGGIAAPSANRSGRISPTTAGHVKLELGNKVDYILDGGACAIGIESTIISLLEETSIILREGNITKNQIADVLGKEVLSKSEKHTLVVPGSSDSHYAPSKPLLLLDTEHLFQKITDLSQTKRIGALSFQPRFSQNSLIEWISTSFDPKIYAKTLYHNLRTLDDSNCEIILVEKPPRQDAWLAVLDRLTRASSTYL